MLVYNGLQPIVLMKTLFNEKTIIKKGFPKNNNNRLLMKTNGLTNIIDNREFTILFVTKYKMLD